MRIYRIGLNGQHRKITEIASDDLQYCLTVPMTAVGGQPDQNETVEDVYEQIRLELYIREHNLRS